MHSTLEWCVDHRVAHIRIDGTGGGGLHELDRLLLNALDQAPGAVHFIFECYKANTFVTMRLGDVIAMHTPRHPNLGWALIAGEVNPLSRSLATLAARMTRARLRFVDSVDDGLQVLTRLDPSLPPVAAPKEA